jgi:hypothetical protein
MLGHSGCGNPFDLCAPQEGRVGFFSRGDCRLTRASFFAGHEWLTLFANDALPPDRRFTEAQIEAIIEGNRRVDFPKELLVHLNHSVVQYANKLQAYHDRPENQPIHFLLGERDDSREAAGKAWRVLEEHTREVLALWVRDNERALALIGRACHTIQDSFSPAHTARERFHRDAPWCVRALKAYIRRAEGYLFEGIEFHGGGEDSRVGHTTSEDSIYREGRDCHDPGSRESVDACLSDEARRAVAATRAYLAMALHLVRVVQDPTADTTDPVAPELDGLIRGHLSLCPD